MTYTQLLVAARKAESEVGNGKSGMVTITAKVATVDDELASLKQQVSDLVAIVKANQVHEENLKRLLFSRIAPAPTKETKLTKVLRYLGVLVNNLVLPDHPKPNKYHGNDIAMLGTEVTWQKNVPHL